MKTLPTFQATIFCGFKPGYSALVKFDEDYFNEAKIICQAYCDKIGFCVTIKPTFFIYTDGSEPGVEVGIINYPRFPKEFEEIKRLALDLAKQLKKHFLQKRVSVVFTDETIMLE
jgi:hypothetical protein